MQDSIAVLADVANHFFATGFLVADIERKAKSENTEKQDGEFWNIKHKGFNLGNCMLDNTSSLITSESLPLFQIG